MVTSSSIHPGTAGSKADEVVARIERLPLSAWHVKVRLIIGVATFFDAFDALAIAFVLPVLVPLWKLTPPEIGFMISTGYLGQLVGALLFGWFAQRFGLVRSMVWSVLVFSVMSIGCALAWDYQSLLVFRTLQGFGLGGEVPIAAVYISEIARAKGRGKFVLMYELVFPIGLVAAGLLGRWIIPNLGWQYMFLIGAIPAILALFMQRLLPESPRWLAVRGRNKEAEDSMAYIEHETEKATGQPLPPAQPVVVTKERPASWTDLFGPQYLRRTLVVWTIWFSAYLITYGLTVWLPTIYRTVFKLPLEQSLQYGLITQIVGLLGTLTCALTIDYFGRRPWFSLAFAGAAVALCTLWFVGAGTPQSVLVFVSIAFFFSSVLSIGVYLYTPELYPTRSRAIGVGTATAWLRLASMIGPSVVGLMIGGGLGNVFLAFGIVAAAAGVVGNSASSSTSGTSSSSDSSSSASSTSQEPAQALAAFMQSLMAALHAQSSPSADADASSSFSSVTGTSQQQPNMQADLQSLIQQVSSSSSSSSASNSSDSTISSLQSSFNNLVSALGGSTSSTATLSSFLQAFSGNVSGASATGNAGSPQDAITQTLSQLGLDSGSSSSTGSTSSTSSTSTQAQALAAFMQNLMTALRAQDADSSSGGNSTTTRVSSSGHHRHNMQADLQSLIQNLSSSTASASTSSTSNSADSSLQQSFQNLVSSLGGSSSSATLSSFLQAFSNNMSGASTSGNVVNTQV